MSSAGLQSVVVLLARMNPIILLVWGLGLGFMRKVFRIKSEYLMFYVLHEEQLLYLLSFLVWAAPELWTADQLQDSRLMARCLKPTLTTTGARSQVLTINRTILMTGVTLHLHHLQPTYSYTTMGPETHLTILSSKIF